MVHVTPPAREHLTNLREHAHLEHPDTAPRLVLAGAGQFGLLPGIRSVGDVVVRHAGAPVLLMDASVAAALDRATIDCQQDREGRHLVVRPPRRLRHAPGHVDGRPANTPGGA